MLKGSFPCLITPLTQALEVDYKALSHLLEMHNLHSDGLVLFGPAGEGWLIEDTERKFLLRHILSVFEKPVIINVSCWNDQHCWKILKEYQDLSDNISGYLLAAPPYLKLSAEQVFDFFNSTLDYLDNKAIIYHNPARNQITFTPQLSNWIQNDSRIQGLCETVAEHCGRYIEDARWTLFAGEDNFIGSGLASSSMSVGGNLFPEVFTKRHADFSWAQWSELLALGPNPVVIKALLYLEGKLEHWGCFSPLGSLSRQRLEIIEKHYQSFKRSTLSSLQFLQDMDT